MESKRLMEFKNAEVTNYLKKKNLSVIECDQNRPWGGWYLIDANPQFDKKILRVVPQTILSLQFHGTPTHPGHLEKWEACTQIRAIVGCQSVVGQSEDILKTLLVVDVEPQGTLIIGSGFVHALANPFSDDIYVVETRESMINETAKERENNIVRIYDQTNRNGTPSFPEDLLNRIMDVNRKADVIVKSQTVFDTTKFSKIN